jgi:hypothetical protein
MKLPLAAFCLWALPVSGNKKAARRRLSLLLPGELTLLMVISARRGERHAPPRLLQRYDVLGLRTCLALGDGELDLLGFGKGLEAGALDGAEVRKHIRAIFALDKAEALRFVKPLNRSSYTF